VAKSEDKWAQMAVMEATQSVANALEFFPFNFPFSIQDKTAIIIHMVEFVFSGINELVGAGDSFTLALTTSNKVTDITDWYDPQILTWERRRYYAWGTAASGMIIQDPFRQIFSDMPGGGILTAPAPLYLAIDTDSIPSATVTGWCRMWYTARQLSTDEYWQLVESRRIVT